MRSPVAWALLGLVIERPSYAYELACRFERVYHGTLALSSVSHVYTALGRLRERGLVREQPARAGENGARRRFEATPTGLGEHADWLVGLLAEERRRQRLLVLQLGALAQEPARALDALERYELECRRHARSASAPSGAGGVSGLVERLAGEEERLALAGSLQWASYARAQLQAYGAGEQGLSEPAAARTA